MALVFALPTPESILVILACEIPTRGSHDTGRAHFAGLSFTSLTSLRAFGRRRKEEMGHAATGGFVHPDIVGRPTGDDDLDCGHVSPRNSPPSPGRERKIGGSDQAVNQEFCDVRRPAGEGWITALRTLKPQVSEGSGPRRRRTTRCRLRWCPTTSSTAPGGGGHPSRRRTTSRAGHRSDRPAAWGRGC